MKKIFYKCILIFIITLILFTNNFTVNAVSNENIFYQMNLEQK